MAWVSQNALKVITIEAFIDCLECKFWASLFYLAILQQNDQGSGIIIQQFTMPKVFH
jgi:hypothetical protein